MILSNTGFQALRSDNFHDLEQMLVKVFSNGNFDQEIGFVDNNNNNNLSLTNWFDPDFRS